MRIKFYISMREKVAAQALLYLQIDAFLADQSMDRLRKGELARRKIRSEIRLDVSSITMPKKRTCWALRVRAHASRDILERERVWSISKKSMGIR